MAFSFKGVESAKELSFISPGIYKVKVTDVEYGTSATKATPYAEFTFSTQDARNVKQKFYITEGTLKQFQYLHETLTGKLLSKSFDTEEQVAEFFKKLFKDPKAPSFNLIVGGEVDADGKVWANVPFAGFITEEDETEFEEGDANWKKYVVKSKRTTEATGKANGVLNYDDEDDKKTKKTTGKGKAKVEDPEEDDKPW